MWDPELYLRFADARGWPFHELVARITVREPRTVVDLGCGPGNLTATLARRWPGARVVGVDSSPEMVRTARAGTTGVTYEVADVWEYDLPADTDVVVTNAVLQWVPGHDELLRHWVADGRWLAMQVPHNGREPGYVLLRELTAAFGVESAVLDGHVGDAVHYARLLREAGCEVDAWETRYIHQLPVSPDGPHPVLTWMEGTALRPVRAALSDADWAAFQERADAGLRQRYPVTGGVVDFPFPRVFVVARRGGLT